jgi:2,5-diketo-D-gluconate reductase A
MVVSALFRVVIALIIVSFSVITFLVYSNVHSPSSSETIIIAPNADQNKRNDGGGASSSSSSPPPLISSSTSIATPTFTLSNNITLPSIGLGSASGVAYPHILHAIEKIGYRFIDTAQSTSWGYRESDVGVAVHDAKLRYQDRMTDSNGDESSKQHDYVFVQTKIHPEDLGYHSTKQALELSLQRLQVTTLDSVLIHKPHCWEGVCAHEPEGTWHDAWEVLQDAMDAGTVRAIGMCDVDDRLLGELLTKRIGPMVIQNWFDPYHQDRAFRHVLEEYNQQNPPSKRILYQGYSTLGTQWFHINKGYTQNPVLNSPILHNIASKHEATVPQVVIQWATRLGVMVLPASTNPSHQESNLNSYYFTLSDEDMQNITDLDGKPPPPEVVAPKEKHPDEVDMEFVNHVDGVVDVYWVPSVNDGDGFDDETSHVHVGKMNGVGDVLKLTSYHGHAFVFKDGGIVTNDDVDGGAIRKRLSVHVVDKSLGSEQQHNIDEEL